jgi:ATP adenylyltransferase
VLVVTKDFQKQTNLLNVNDFEAACIAMKSLDESFVYFNSGKNAGASQAHKHLQVMPID